MSFPRQCANFLKPRLLVRHNVISRRLRSSVVKVDPATVDEDGIPLRPTWSVNDLLSSYPKPTITPATLKRMYELSALVPPTEGTPEHAEITREMEELIKLVEAVKLVHIDEEQGAEVPDGRIWAEGTGILLETQGKSGEQEEEASHGRALLRHAQRTHNGLYVVDKSSRKE